MFSNNEAAVIVALAVVGIALIGVAFFFAPKFAAIGVGTCIGRAIMNRKKK